MRGRLPLRFLGATVLIALFWFLIMFMYIDDLMSDDQGHKVTGHGSKVTIKVTSRVRGYRPKDTGHEPKVKDKVKSKDVVTSRLRDKNQMKNTKNKLDVKAAGNVAMETDRNVKFNEKYDVSNNRGQPKVKVKRSRAWKLRADRRKRHRKWLLSRTTTVSDFVLLGSEAEYPYNDDVTETKGPRDHGNNQQGALVNGNIPGTNQKTDKNLKHISAPNKTFHKTTATTTSPPGRGRRRDQPDRGRGWKDHTAGRGQQLKHQRTSVNSLTAVISKVRDITREQTNNLRKKLRRPHGSRDRVNASRDHQGASRDRMLDHQDGFRRHSFNVSASDAELVDRVVMDTRPRECLSDDDVTGTRLPASSVIICFHNEAWSTLMRTVHSVLNRSPDELIQEVILVDDFSTYDYLGRELEDYVSLLPKVRLVRTTRREGLVRARVLGMSYAQAEILVFLDSHCECNQGWLPPLLKEIVKDPTKIVSPELDIIDPVTFEYKPGPIGMHGAFDWLLQFTWKHIPGYHGDRDSARPIRTPVMIGGIFAVNKRFFENLGGFDEGMEIWGGENLELSFRTWCCGGSLWISPCSRVGHVFRAVIPYSFPDGAGVTVNRNSARVAETWLGRHKFIYYALQESPRDPSVASDVTERRAFLEGLGCKSFDWYLDHVTPETQVPPAEALYFGNLEQTGSGSHACVAAEETSQNSSSLPVQPRHLVVNNCDKFNPDQTFYVTSDGELRHNTFCMTVTSQRELVLAPCDRNTNHWKYNKQTGQLITTLPTSASTSATSNATSGLISGVGLCLTLMTSPTDVTTLHLTPCAHVSNSTTSRNNVINAKLDLNGVRLSDVTSNLTSAVTPKGDVIKSDANVIKAKSNVIKSERHLITKERNVNARKSDVATLEGDVMTSVRHAQSWTFTYKFNVNVLQYLRPV